MTHRDWKGEGWYDKYKKNDRELIKSSYYDSDYLSDAHRYVPRLSPIPPKSELSDGIYIVRHYSSPGVCMIETHEKNDGLWNGMFNCETLEMFIIIGRVPVEPIE